MGAVSVEPVASKRQLEAFIDVQDQINASDPNWVAPIKLERLEHYNPKKNVFLGNMAHQFWLAYHGGRPVGRISAQVNRHHLKRHQDATGQFGSFDCVDDVAVAKALIDTAKAWLSERGMVRMTGPFSHSINEEAGVLVEGFDRPPNLMMCHNPTYYDGLLGQLGLVKAQDLFCYDFDIRSEFSPKLTRIIERFHRNADVKIRQLDKRRYDAEIDLICDIFNDAWHENWGFIPFGSDEARYLGRSLKPIIDPDLVLIAELKGRPIAMIIDVPNVNEAAADIGGKLLPLGWAKLLWRLKVRGTKSSRVPLMGVRREFRPKPLSGIVALGLIARLREIGLGKGIETAELSWILEDNQHMNNILIELGADHYKTYRIYETSLV